MSQINQLAGDSSYNGVNLLNGNNLTIDFNPTGTSSLTITGVNFNASGLGLASITGSVAGSFQDSSALNTAVTNINAAISNVQTQTETFGTNSGVIGTRQTFETNMINTLQTGASNLVVGGPEPAERQPFDRADPAAAGNLRTVNRQPGEPVSAQAVRLKLFWYRPTVKAAGRKLRRFSFDESAAVAKSLHSSQFSGFSSVGARGGALTCIRKPKPDPLKSIIKINRGSPPERGKTGRNA